MGSARDGADRVFQFGRHTRDNLLRRDSVIDKLVSLAGPEIDQIRVADSTRSHSHWRGHVVDLWVRRGCFSAVACHEAVNDAARSFAAKGARERSAAAGAQPVAMRLRSVCL